MRVHGMTEESPHGIGTFSLFDFQPFESGGAAQV